MVDNSEKKTDSSVIIEEGNIEIEIYSIN